MTPVRRSAIGTYVKFPRKGRKNGHRYDWLDEGRIEKVNVYSYVIRNADGELFVRSFDEIEVKNDA